nr:MAG TPA: putative Fe-S oxidoreductase [Caudoviricetes sp.]
MEEMKRYGVVNDFKEQMEVVLLRGTGCQWGQCSFCDYCLDKDIDENENYELNKPVLDKITGQFQKAQIICSGSFAELDPKTLNYIHEVAVEKHLTTIIFEGHYMHRKYIKYMRLIFTGINLEFIVGGETFNLTDRERVLHKGMGVATAKDVSKYFNRTNLLFGWRGQTMDSFKRDIELGLQYFDRICINVFTPNTTPMERDNELVSEFYNSQLFKKLMNNPRVRIIDDLNRDITDTFDLVGEKLSKIGGTK